MSSAVEPTGSRFCQKQNRPEGISGLFCKLFDELLEVLAECGGVFVPVTFAGMIEGDGEYLRHRTADGQRTLLLRRILSTVRRDTFCHKFMTKMNNNYHEEYNINCRRRHSISSRATGR